MNIKYLYCAAVSINILLIKRFNCATVAQYNADHNALKFVKEFFAKASNNEKLSDLVKKFVAYFEYQKGSCNIVHLFHDREGYNEEVNSKNTLAEDVENILRASGWKLINKTPNTNNSSLQAHQCHSIRVTHKASCNKNK